MDRPAETAQPPMVTGGVPSFRSPSGKRMYPRVRIPAEADFNGMCFPLADLSVGGFAFLTAGPDASRGDPIRCHIHIGGRDLRMTIEVTARVVRVENGRATAVQFIDLPLHSANAIDWVVDAWLGGQPDGVPALGPPLTSTEAPRHDHFAQRHLRSAALLGLGAVVVVAMATMLAAHFLIVRSEFAAVSAPLRLIRAPQPGLLTLQVEDPGSPLRLNQKLGEIRPTLAAADQVRMEPQVLALEAQVSALEAELADAGYNAGSFSTQAQTDLAAASQTRQLVERQVAAQERLYQRLKGLSQQSFVSSARIDQEEVALMARRRELTEAIAAENTARLMVKQGRAGRYRADGRPTARGTSVVKRELDAARASLRQARSAITQRANPVPLLSPCDCTLAQLDAPTGTVVATGDPIARLAAPQRELGAEVDALVLAGRMPFLRTGQSVNVFLGGMSDAVSGRIVALNYNPESAGRTGLPDSLRTQRSFGLVTVMVPQSAMTRQTGLPAVVEAPIELRTLLLNLPGISWFFGKTPAQNQFG